MQSASSSITPAQLIDEIICTSAEGPDSDLSRFVKKIDVLLAHHEAQLRTKSTFQQRKKNLIQEKSGELPRVAEASNFSEQVSTNVEQITTEIKEYSGNKQKTSIGMLKAIQNVHWNAVGFLIVGASLNFIETMENNQKECLRLLKSMLDLSKIILQLRELRKLNMELHVKLNESIQLIVSGAILCCSIQKRKGWKRMLNASKDRENLQQLSSDINQMCTMLHLDISLASLKDVQSDLRIRSSHIAYNQDAVGIDEKIQEVIHLLDWESDRAATAAVVYGVGGSGKTTLADAVYFALKERLQGWKHSKVSLPENFEENLKIEDVQSMILEDLIGSKQVVRDFQCGRQFLKDIIEKEPSFLYIDNALYLEPLEKLLPRDLASAKKFRLLLTAREANVSGVIKYCGIEDCRLYLMEPLSVEAALQILCRRIDREREIESILQERPQVREIAEKCNCCPLMLEVTGAYIHQRKNKVEAYEKVLNSLESGENFSSNKKYTFDEKRVMFAFDQLNSSAQEAFFEICSHFSGWEWKQVALIVGEEDMECLQNGALIKEEDGRIKIHYLILAAGHHKLKRNQEKSIKQISPGSKIEEKIVSGDDLRGNLKYEMLDLQITPPAFKDERSRLMVCPTPLPPLGKESLHQREPRTVPQASSSSLNTKRRHQMQLADSSTSTKRQRPMTLTDSCASTYQLDRIEEGTASQVSPLFSIIGRVRPNLRDLHKETYDPTRVGLGIYHHEMTPYSSEMGEEKVKALCITTKRLQGFTVENLVAEIQKLDLEIRKCYTDTREDLSQEMLAWNFAMDTCFILEFFRSLYWFSDRAIEREIMIDIFKLENQIPLFILIKIFEIEFQTREKAIFQLSDVLCMHPNITILPFSLQPVELNILVAEVEAHIKEDPCHLLHLLSKVIESFLRPSNIVTRDTGVDIVNDWIEFISAVINRDVNIVETLLIRFKSSKNGQVRFEKGWFGSAKLYLPQIYLLKETEPLLWNMIAFAVESNSNIIGHYIVFMKCLISLNRKNVGLLKKKQIIMTERDNQELITIFNNLSTVLSESCGPFEDIQSQVREHYSNPVNKWMLWLKCLLFQIVFIGFALLLVSTASEFFIGR